LLNTNDLMKLNWFTSSSSNKYIEIVGVPVLYVVAAQLGLLLTSPDIGNYIVWPPSGVALGLMILLGYRIWPGILIGSLITYSYLFINQGLGINTSMVVAVLSISIANVVEAMVGNKLYNMFISKGETPFEQTSNTFKLLIINMVIAFISTLVYTLNTTGSLLSQTVFSNDSFTFHYLAEISGLFLFTNVVLVWTMGKTYWKISWASSLEAIFFNVVLILILIKVNQQDLSMSLEHSFHFLIIPFLLLVAFRSSIHAALLVVLTIALFSIYITIQGSGPFILNNYEVSVMSLQLFVIITTATTVLLSVTVYERADGKNKLEKFSVNLEAMVNIRTKELLNEIKIRQKTEKKIRKTIYQLQQRNSEIDNFSYKVSHDLRAPISSILGLINIAKADKDLDNVLKCIEGIEISALKQDDFIRDIIELTNNARVKPKPEIIDFKRIVEQTFDTLKHSMNNDLPKLKLQIKQEKDFYSDINRVKIIFNNIITNSIQYSNPENTKVNINVDVINGHAKISIQDNGRGIEKKYLDDVFRMFYRATDQNAGSGLGLYIVKEIIDILKGNISLESEINKGTSFIINLPDMGSAKSRKLFNISGME